MNIKKVTNDSFFLWNWGKIASKFDRFCHYDTIEGRLFKTSCISVRNIGEGRGAKEGKRTERREKKSDDNERTSSEESLRLEEHSKKTLPLARVNIVTFSPSLTHWQLHLRKGKKSRKKRKYEEKINTRYNGRFTLHEFLCTKNMIDGV